jgi:hypothetical protein
MLENCLSGSEGGGAFALPTPIIAFVERHAISQAILLPVHVHLQGTRLDEPTQAGSLSYPFDALSLAQGAHYFLERRRCPKANLMRKGGIAP